jgi:EpsI family protein
VASGPTLADTVPRDFSGWTTVMDSVAQVGTAATVSQDSPYSEQLLRSYRDRNGHTVMLTLAYVEKMRPYVLPHPPDGCYAAAGFDIQSLTPVRLQSLEAAHAQQPLTAQRMVAQRDMRREAVVFWMRFGDVYRPQSSIATRWQLLQAELRGGPTDGILVRASMLLAPGDEPAAAHAVLERFLADLLAASPESVRRKMRQP